MSVTLDYGRPPTSRWPSVVLWAGCVLAFGVFSFGVFSYVTRSSTGAIVPTASETILRCWPQWFMYPYSGLIAGIGERGMFWVVLEVLCLYPLYAILLGIAAYRGRPWRLLIILLIIHLVLGMLGIWSFVRADAAFHRRQSAQQTTRPRDNPTLHWTGPASCVVVH